MKTQDVIIVTQFGIYTKQENLEVNESMSDWILIGSLCIVVFLWQRCKIEKRKSRIKSDSWKHTLNLYALSNIKNKKEREKEMKKYFDEKMCPEI